MRLKQSCFVCMEITYIMCKCNICYKHDLEEPSEKSVTNKMDDRVLQSLSFQEIVGRGSNYNRYFAEENLLWPVGIL